MFFYSLLYCARCSFVPRLRLIMFFIFPRCNFRSQCTIKLIETIYNNILLRFYALIFKIIVLDGPVRYFLSRFLNDLGFSPITFIRWNSMISYIWYQIYGDWGLNSEFMSQKHPKLRHICDADSFIFSCLAIYQKVSWEISEKYLKRVFGQFNLHKRQH